MIPILYDVNEVSFTSNGLGRLRDCISCIVTEERNGIYECDFEYPITGANYDLIQLGRVIGVTHDESGDVQPFDIVSLEKPIDGVVTFHCVHISYRQSYMTVTGSNINSLSGAFALLGTAQPSNPFSYSTDKTSTGYLAAADGIPKSVRQMLGGVEGSILDVYGGEYEWDKFNVILHSSRGQLRDFTIRYGVNMLDFNDETDTSGNYSSCIPYWTDGTNTVVGDRQDSSGTTVTGRGECIPLDVSDRFKDQPTKAQVEAMGLAVMNASSPYLPAQTISISFVRLQDMSEYSNFKALLNCGLCDTVKVIFPDYSASGNFKIVKTTWNVLSGRYEEMELGTLSTTLAEALGLTDNTDKASPIAYVIEQGTSSGWVYQKWNNGKIEMWYTDSFSSAFTSSNFGGYRGTAQTVSLPSLNQTSILWATSDVITPNTGFSLLSSVSTSSITVYPYNRTSQSSAQTCTIYLHVVATV